MTLQEYLNSINNTSRKLSWFQSSQLANFLHTTDGLTKSIANQRRITDMFATNGLTEAIARQKELTNHLEITSRIFESLNPCSNLVSSFKTQETIFTELTSRDINLSENCLPSTTSDEFCNSATEILNELESSGLESENIQSFSDIITSSQVKPMSWDMLMNLILFLINIILFVQAKLPNQQLTTIEKQISQLVELQLKAITLVEPSPSTLLPQDADLIDLEPEKTFEELTR